MTVQTDVEATCGCKGVRYCAKCIDTARVSKLNLTTDDKYRDYTIFVYQPALGKAYECPTLNYRSTVAEIAVAAAAQSAATGDFRDEVELDGLMLVHDFISEDEERELVAEIDKKEWALSQSGRRKQVSRF